MLLPLSKEDFLLCVRFHPQKLAPPPYPHPFITISSKPLVRFTTVLLCSESVGAYLVHIIAVMFYQFSPYQEVFDVYVFNVYVFNVYVFNVNEYSIFQFLKIIVYCAFLVACV